MIRSNEKSLFWIALCAPLLMLFIASQMSGFNGLKYVKNVARRALKLYTVQRPQVSAAAVRYEARQEDPTLFSSPARVTGILGTDSRDENLYVVLYVGLEGESPEDGDEETLEEDAEEGEIQLPSTYLCRISLKTGEIDWLTQNEYLRGIFRPRILDRRFRAVGWVSVPVPELDDEGNHVESDVPFTRSFWKYVSGEGRGQLYSERRLQNGLILSPNGDCAAYVSKKSYRLRSQRVFPPPDSGWNGVMDARIDYLSSDCNTAIGSILFPRLGPIGFTELVEYDFSTGEILSAMDQPGLRPIVPKSLQAISDEAFVLRSNGKIRIDEPFSLVSLYRTRPIRHILDTPGFTPFAANDSSVVMVLDSSENILFRDRDSVVADGRPILRFIDLNSDSVETVDSLELIPDIEGKIRFEHLLHVWRTNNHTSPLAPDDGWVLLPNETSDTPAYVIELESKQAHAIELDHPVNSFAWSASGQHLVMSSTLFKPVKSRRANSESGLTRTEIVADSAETQADTSEEEVEDRDSGPLPMLISVWDREAGDVVASFEFQGIPIGGNNEDGLLLLRSQLEEQLEPGGQTRLVFQYSLEDRQSPTPMNVHAAPLAP